MFRLSNNLVGILNLFSFVLSIPILAGGIWLSHRASTDCEKFLQTPMIFIGAFLMAVSIAGLVGACCRNSLLLWIYLFVMFLLILLLFSFTVFAFVVTNKGAGQAVSGKGYKEYRLGDYSNWLQKRVDSSKNWAKIRSCLVDGKVCQSLIDDGNQTSVLFFKEDLSPVQVGESIEEIERHLPSSVKDAAQKAPEVARSISGEVQRAGVVGTATGLARSAYSKAEPTAKVLYSKYEPVAEHYAVSAWRSLNRLPLFPHVAQIVVPTAAYWSDKYNKVVVNSAEKGYAVSGYLPLVPVEKIAKVFGEEEKGVEMAAVE